MNFVKPSPSFTTKWAKLNISLDKYLENFIALGSFKLCIVVIFAFPVATTKRLSDVEVSLSTVIELKEVLLHFITIFWSIFASIEISEKINASIVAILGAIIPEPFAIPFIFIGIPFKINSS